MDDAPQGSPAAKVARRRYLTLLFSDLSDSTTLAGAIEPEQYLEIIEHLSGCAARVLAAYRGTLIGFHGDGLLAMFGFPDAGETDGRRATDAALELHSAFGEGPAALHRTPWGTLRLHSGIHSGLVLLIEGAPSPGAFTVIGEPPNVAARLSAAAGRNEILVSATTLGADRHFFETVERGAIRLKGKVAPVQTYQVLRRGAVKTRFEATVRRGLTPLIGRHEPLQRLEACLANVMGGHLRAAAIVAPPGVGKTRLATEFLRRAVDMGCSVHRGYCENRPGAEPLQPFVEMLRSLCRLEGGASFSLDAIPPAVANHAGLRAEVVRAASATGVAAPGSLPEATSGDATGTLADLFRTLARHSPTILFIDDWHWVDEGTRRVVAALREDTTLPLMVLIASRSGDESDAFLRGADVVPLAPLDARETVETIQTLRPDADFLKIREIVDSSGGNPLFIEELCHVPPRDWALYAARRASEGPAWLNTLIESRVARLPASEADLVRTAAIIGNVLPLWLLERLCGRDEGAAIADALAEHDFLYPGERPGTLRFKHGITRDVIYNSIGLAERREAHLRIAQLIEARGADNPDDVIETLAYHFHAAGHPAQTARYAALAGDKAMAAPALDRARTQYGTALEALDALPPTDETYERWKTIAQRLGLACVYDPTRDQLEPFHRAVELASARDDHVWLAQAEYWLAYITYALGDVKTAIDRCLRARQRCQDALTSAQGALVGELRALEVQVLAILGQAHSAACEHHLAIAELHEVVETRRRYKGGRRLSAGSAYTLACRGASLGDLGRFDEAHACFNEALEAVGDGDHAVKGSVLNWQAGVHLWQGRWEDARATSQIASIVAEQIESLYVWGMAQSIHAYASWMGERRPESIDVITRTVSWLEARDKRLFISIVYSWLADAFADLGHHREARLYASRAIRRARARDGFGEAMALRALARCSLDRAMQSAERRTSPHEIASTLLEQARRHMACGRQAEAMVLLHRARAAFDAMGMSWHAARSQQLMVSAP